MDFEMPPRPTAVQLSGRGGGRGGGRGRGSSRPGGAARGGGRGRGSFGRGGSSASKFSKPKPHFKKGGAMPATITVARRVYVGNLSWRTSWQDLKVIASSAPVVMRVCVRKCAYICNTIGTINN